jgi:hypothetical protein
MQKRIANNYLFVISANFSIIIAEIGPTLLLETFLPSIMVIGKIFALPEEVIKTSSAVQSSLSFSFLSIKGILLVFAISIVDFLVIPGRILLSGVIMRPF